MSGHILFDKDLRNDGRVLALADAMYARLTPSLSDDERNALRNSDPTLSNAAHNAVLGGLMSLWSYADEHIRQDNTMPISTAHLAKQIALPVEILLMLPAEWLVVRSETQVELPQYVEKNAILDKDIRRERERTGNAIRQAKWRERQRLEMEALRNASRNAPVTELRNGSVTPSRAPARTHVPSHSHSHPTHTEAAAPGSVSVSRGTKTGPDPQWLLDFKLTYPEADRPHHWRSFKRAALEAFEAGVVMPERLIDGARSYAAHCTSKRTVRTRYVMSPHTFLSEGHYDAQWLTEPESRELGELQRLMDRRASIGLADFRDPHEGEAPDEYRRAQDAAWNERQSAQPRFGETAAGPARLTDLLAKVKPS